MFYASYFLSLFRVHETGRVPMEDGVHQHILHGRALALPASLEHVLLGATLRNQEILSM